MLGIEVDGYSHELIEVFKKDVIKEKKINELGIFILRFTDYPLLKDTFNVLFAIEDYFTKYEKHTPNPSQVGN